MTGSGFRDGLTVSFGDGITVDSVALAGSTEFSADITIAADAVLGPRDITVTNSDGQVGVGAGLFTVVEDDPSTGYLWFVDNGNDLLYRYSINDGAVLASYPDRSGGSGRIGPGPDLRRHEPSG